ncbi:hypothetical protein [Paraclostridium bifermentans]|uniref:hypothetical protein n=1 Tax=Paraclostridium bifermentans TaxID=1490 RepID=UPI00115C1793|nr:hypothetical protein [Paraclostridium bifermentans]TQO55583.1 hypothetical protein D5S05_17370 [Paraclostridium bifermentans]
MEYIIKEIMEHKKNKESTLSDYVKDKVDRWRLIHSGLKFFSLEERYKMNYIDYDLESKGIYMNEDNTCIYGSDIWCKNLEAGYYSNITINFLFEGTDINLSRLVAIHYSYTEKDSDETLEHLTSIPRDIQKFQKYFNLFTREEAIENIIKRYTEDLNNKKQAYYDNKEFYEEYKEFYEEYKEFLNLD